MSKKTRFWGVILTASIVTILLSEYLVLPTIPATEGSTKQTSHCSFYTNKIKRD